MPASARLFATVPLDQRDRLSQLAYAKGLSVPRLLAGLVDKALAENPEEKVRRLRNQAQVDRAPAERYTVRLMGADAARLEERAQGRSVTASGYVVHLLRAHLRAEPPMPYKEFQELKRVVNELEGIRLALQQLVTYRSAREAVEVSLRENVLRLLPALKQIRDKIQDTLVANSKSWEVPNA
ncbi:MAG: hypothetical protein ABI145_15660 [Steroidobacteraceae bacterium]